MGRSDTEVTYVRCATALRWVPAIVFFAESANFVRMIVVFPQSTGETKTLFVLTLAAMALGSCAIGLRCLQIGILKVTPEEVSCARSFQTRRINRAEITGVNAVPALWSWLTIPVVELADGTTITLSEFGSPTSRASSDTSTVRRVVLSVGDRADRAASQ